MPSKRMLMKQTWYPLQCDMEHSWTYDCQSANKWATIYPLLHRDEGLGSPSNVNTNPKHASFNTWDYSGVHVGSKVFNNFAKLELSLTPEFYDNNLNVIDVFYDVIALAFKDNYDAEDEISTLSVKNVLELTTEDTDRQGGALYNGTDMDAKYTGSSTLGASQPFLTTDTKLEGVDFNFENFYDALGYTTIAGKLKKVQSGLKWLKLSRNKPIARIPIHIKSSAKTSNPYTFEGVLVGVPLEDTHYQTHVAADFSTASKYVDCRITVRHNIWNEYFNFKEI